MTVATSIGLAVLMELLGVEEEAALLQEAHRVETGRLTPGGLDLPTAGLRPEVGLAETLPSFVPMPLRSGHPRRGLRRRDPIPPTVELHSPGARRHRDIRRCFQHAPTTTWGRVQIDVEITTRGRGRNAVVVLDTTGQSEPVKCVVRAARTWRFDPTVDRETITFDLEPGNLKRPQRSRPR